MVSNPDARDKSGNRLGGRWAGDTSVLHLFLDANTLLGLYELTPSEVSELEKLPSLVEAGEVELWLPEMVVDEYVRNRPRVIASILKNLRDARVVVRTPSLAEGDQAAALSDVLRDAHRKHRALVMGLEDLARDEKLHADLVIGSMIKVARSPSIGASLDRARTRRDLRKPPGKGDSLGDAVCWEALLDEVPEGDDIHLVTADADFGSPLRADALHEYLDREWRERKKSNALLYR